jgi:FLVCR family MFS transporter 7
MIDNSEITNYRVYPIRWVHLLVYVLANFANAMNSITFAPIESETAQFFGVTTTQVNVLAVVFLFLYVVGTILTIWIYRLLSLRMGLIVGTILNLGVFIRLFALISPTNGYPALVIGQIIPAIAQPFFLNITALFAARWFAVKQRDIATAIGSMANPLGIIQNE